MTDRAIAELLHERIVADRRRSYGATLQSATRADLRDGFWGRFLPFFDALGAEDRQLMLDLTTQVSVDTIAALLALVDDGEMTLNAGGKLWAAFAEHDDAVRAS